MADAPKDVAQKIQTPGFSRAQPPAVSLSDPIADTPMVVTLDELTTYENNPRVTRNEKYDDIKASIRERGLDAPPPITRRPGAAKYIIRNGGNTRLSILRELWAETRDEQFFRIRCLFRPWPERGEIVVLTGHLAEGDLHGALTFIERALSVEKARILYEADAGGAPISQSELARRLTADGYPITQSQISRMQDTIRHVLPAIPTALYGGLGRDQIERITALRKASAHVHAQHGASEQAQSPFSEVFQSVLAQFDGPPESFNLQRVRDELIGQLSSMLGIDYDSLAIEVVDAETRPALTARETMFHVKPSVPVPKSADFAPSPPFTHDRAEALARVPPPNASAAPIAVERNRPSTPLQTREDSGSSRRDSTSGIRNNGTEHIEGVRGSVIGETQPTDRVQAIRRLVADATGTPLEDLRSETQRSMPVAAGDRTPSSDIWHIAPEVDAIDSLRIHAAQLAAEIAREVGAATAIEPVNDGIGFTCAQGSVRQSDRLTARASLMLLSAISLRFLLKPTRPVINDVRLSEYLAALLMGERPGQRLAELRLSDASLVKLFRLIRLGRRILELQLEDDASSEESTDAS
jgi:ParB family protein of integrating conjugative element (PFGI_1 class)